MHHLAIIQPVNPNTHPFMTSMQLCHDRGYLVTRQELEETLEQFKASMLSAGYENLIFVALRCS